MLDGLDILDGLVEAANDLANAALSAQFYSLEWTPPQWAFLLDPSTEKLFRAGNQHTGKSTTGLAEVVGRCLGEHPLGEHGFAYPEPPIEAWIICVSWQQSVAVQNKLWEMLPKDVLDERTTFDEAQGFSPIKSPVVRFRNGSIIRIKTTNQGGLNLAGATIDVVMIDELTTERIYQELQRRVLMRAGVIIQTLTPINAPSEWLQKLTETVGPDGKPLIRDHWFRFEAKNFVPVGKNEPRRLKDGTPMDEAWVATQRAKYPDENVAAVILDGAWQTNHSHRELKGFTDAVLFGDADLEVMPEIVEYGLGMDHGEGVGREWAGLVGWDGWTLWVLAEYTNDGTTGPEADARGIEKAIRSMGLRLEHVRRAIGDINSAGYAGGGLTVNEALQEQFNALCGGQAPFRIDGANKAKGTVRKRSWMLNNAMLDGRLRVHSGCTRLIQAMRQWKGKESETAQYNGQRVFLKDPIDGLGYVAVEYLGDLAQPSKLTVVAGDGRRGGRR